MQTILTIIFSCSLINACVIDIAGSEFAQKTDEELAALSRKPDQARQIDILSILAVRYRQPGEIVIRSRVPFQEARPMSKAESSVIITNVFEVAKLDRDRMVRVAALDLMKVLLNRTNILELFHGFLGDSELAVRVRSCAAIIDFVKERGMILPLEVIDSLAHSLDISNDSSSLCVALKYVGELGNGASNCAPQVLRLTKHRTKEVRAAAKVALHAIEPKSPKLPRTRREK